MKRLIFALAFLGAGYWVALNQIKVKSWWDRTVKAVDGRYAEPPSDAGPAAETADASPGRLTPPVAKAAPAIAEPSPEPSPGPPPVPARARVLEEGLFYTRERLSQATDLGIVAIPERTMVYQVGEEDGLLLVESQGTRVLTSRSKLTNDLDEVQALLQESNAVALAAVAKPGQKSSRPPSTAADDAKLRELNGAKWRVLHARIFELERLIKSAKEQIGQLRYESRISKSNGRPSTYNDRPIAILQARIDAMEAERSNLHIQRAAIVR